jgi:arginine N-succinyltransferase
MIETIAALDRPVFRPARSEDVDGLYRLARAAGTGLTNLPADRRALSGRVASGLAALESEGARRAGAPMLFVLDLGGAFEPGRRIVGSACIFTHVGVEWPFYSYRITRQVQTSKALGKSVAHDVLVLVNDLDGSAEVGGLFVDPGLRGVAAGRLAARSRYVFLAEHRDWFGRQIISELRGHQDENGRSVVWEALGREFYDMDFAEADHVSGTLGSQFIADLSPKHPIYANLLPREAREALGQPHPDSRRARDLLVQEGFRSAGYVDIFDGGPTLFAEIDDLKAVRNSRRIAVAGVEIGSGAEDCLVSAGLGPEFRAARGAVTVAPDGAWIEPGLASALRIGAGDWIRYVAF